MSYLSDTPETQQSKFIGQVKWFNNKAGYGFITINNGEHVGKDIFTHYSNIKSSNDQLYKYLIQGEYVEFEINKSDNEKHEFQATNISGINCGPLMCETRRSVRSYDNSEHEVNRRYQTKSTDKPSDVKRISGDEEFISVRKRRGPSNRGGRGFNSRRGPKPTEPLVN
jgi:cold shock CspA family protein